MSRSTACSTSKVPVVTAFLDRTADGKPGRISSANRALVRAALARSDEDAVLRLRNQIPGRSGLAMTAVLRQIGDRTTVARTTTRAR